MQAFDDSGFRRAYLKCLILFCKYIQAVTLAGIATVDVHRISHHSFEAHASDGLCGNTDWPKAPPASPSAFITL